MAALFVVITLTVVGVMIVLAMDAEASGPSLIGLGFLYGAGAVYVVMLLLSVAGIRWSMLNVTAILLLASGVRRLWQHWGQTPKFAQQILGSDPNVSPHPDYPLLLPLNYAFVALANGEWSDRWIAIHSAAFALALLLIIREEAARQTSRYNASIITLATTAFVLSPQIGLADGPVIAFGTAGLLLLRRGDSRSFRHGAIVLGLAMTLCIAVLIAFAVARTPLRKFAGLWPAVLLAAPWLILRAMHHLHTDLAAPGMFDRLTAPIPALPQLGATMLESLSNQLLWALIALSIFIVPLRLLRSEKFVLVTIVMQLLFFTLAYLVTPLDAAWHVVSSFGRISTHLGAPTLFVIMSMLARTAAK